MLRFRFDDVETYPDWWLVAVGEQTDLCVKDPGKEVDVYFTCKLKTLVGIWMGKNNYRSAIRDGSLKVVGPSALTRDISAWMRNSIFAKPQALAAS